MIRLPSDWNSFHFGDYFDVLSGYGFKKSEYSRDGIRLLRIDNVGYGQIQWDSIAYLPENYVDSYEQLVLHEGDILLALNRPITNGRLKIGRLTSGDAPAILYQRVGKIVSLTDNTDYDFAFYLLQHYLLSFVQQYAIGSDQPYISLTELRKYRLPLPPLPEQRKIAQILSTWDEAIALVEALIAALQERKKGLMQRLLTGEVRDCWNISKLGNVTEVTLSGVNKKSYEDEQVVRLCNYTDVFYNAYITNEMSFLEATASEREIEKCELRQHDVVITKDSETPEDIAQAAVVSEELDNVICGYHMAILRPVENMIWGPFLRELIMTPDVHYQFERKANGATRFGLTLSSIRNVDISFPSLEEQKDIVEVFYTCDRWIAGLREYIRHLSEQKKGLMQRLLTGEVRVEI